MRTLILPHIKWHLLLSLAVTLCAWNTYAEEDLLRVEQAFQYSVSSDADAIYVNWKIAPDYYMYKSRMSYSTDNAAVTLGEPSMPKGKIKNDEYFGRQEIFRNGITVSIPYSGQASEIDLKIQSQGCADAGLCYPPQRWNANVQLAQVIDAMPAAANQAMPEPAMDMVSDSNSGSNGGLLDALAGSAQFGGEDNYLSPDDAFRLSALMIDDTTLMVRWDIEEGYYLYKDKLKLSIDGENNTLDAVNWPAGKRKHDEHFGTVDVFYTTAETNVKVLRGSADASVFELNADFQGCAEDGICYPPDSRILSVTLDQTGADISAVAAGSFSAGDGGSSSGTVKVSEQDKLAGLIRDGSLPAVMATFFGLGLLLAFTPCVLPMVPILSGIIGGQKGEMTTRKSFTLSLVYVLSMALTYTVIGIIVAMLGKNVQAIFQNPVVLISFSIVFVALALSMFDVWQFQMPVSVQNKLNQAGSGGGYFGVGIMGLLSALIVGPCVAAPLVAALIFIGQSGDAVRGGLTLFALAMGMGTPLLAYGATAGQLMLRAGPWMVVVKRLFGIMLLGVAIWLMARILSPQIIMLLWAALAALTAWAVGLFNSSGSKVFRLVGAASAVYAVALAVSALSGGYNPIKLTDGTPWGEEEHHLTFVKVSTVDELSAAVASAAAQGKPAILDFYADWCVECIKMENETFNKLSVQQALGDTVLLQADVTKNDDNDQALLQHFGIYGPPTIAFFDRSGNERRNFRVVGFMGEEEFAQHSAQAIKP